MMNDGVNILLAADISNFIESLKKWKTWINHHRHIFMPICLAAFNVLVIYYCLDRSHE